VGGKSGSGDRKVLMDIKLNSRQLEAVNNTSGPLLIIAGAGSGKTRTLVERTAGIISKGLASPWEIMTVTFTNKAAKELTGRIVARVGKSGEGVFAGTFHSICARLLRRNCERLGYKPNFVIYDSDDSVRVLKQAIKNNNLSTSLFPAKKIASLISSLKNRLIYPETYRPDDEDHLYFKIKDIYTDYQKELTACNAFDFDDLLAMTVILLRSNKDVLEEYQNIIKYVLVDEYQDTNFVQDEFVSLVSGLYNNVCVVGDEDQSIYSWRGADIGNILNFPKKHPGCAIIKLEENYRSSTNILDTANAVIAKNTERLGKNLFSSSSPGEKIKLNSFGSDTDEGRFVADSIDRMRKDGNRLKDICILYRTNSQSRVIEENLRKNSIPYTVVGGLKFYERKEIKDITAYLRLLVNHDDNVSFERIVNFPPRGAGKKMLETIKYEAGRKGSSYYSALKNGIAEGIISDKKMIDFIDMIENNSGLADGTDASKISEKIFRDSKLMDYYVKFSDRTEDSSRIDNLYEFLNGVSQFVKSESENSLISFLTSVSLISDIDTYDENEDRTALMTVHSAKGLEFDHVFITGLNDGLFPFINPAESLKIEEERRLFYVALTRARKTVNLSTYRRRSKYFGNSGEYIPSRFIDDVPEKTVDSSGYEKYDAGRLGFERENRYDFARANVRSEPAYQKKDMVYSKQFGEGIVLELEDMGSKKVVTVDFDDFGIKKLIVKYADLKKI
jgi:DNA helicase II / ATP-dependent DNA helicase PcrA